MGCELLPLFWMIGFEEETLLENFGEFSPHVQGSYCFGCWLGLLEATSSTHIHHSGLIYIYLPSVPTAIIIIATVIFAFSHSYHALK